MSMNDSMLSSIPILEGDAFLNRLQTSLGRDRHPLSAQWEITARCNFKCVMCYTDCMNTPKQIQQELSTSEIFKIMDEMKAAGVMELTLTGGEPMSHPDFKAIYLRSIQNGFLTTVFTNGSFINESWIKVWQEFPPHRIEISIHGATQTTFDQVTAIEGSYERVMKAVELVTQAKLPLTVKTTGLLSNQHEILEIKKRMKETYGVHARFNFHLRPETNGGQTPYQYQITEEAMQTIFESDPDFKQESQALDEKQESCPTTCHEGKKQFHIDAYGQLQLCSRNRTNSYDLRKGSFTDGFYQNLPAFFCARKKSDGACCTVSSEEVSHAAH